MKRYIISAESDFAIELDHIIQMKIVKEKNKKYCFRVILENGQPLFLHLGRYSSKKVACRALEKVLDWMTDDYSIINVPTERDVRLHYMN